MNDPCYVSGEIQKVEEQPDGTLIIQGVASSEVPDSQGEIITAEAVRKAIPGYMSAPALREMHRPDSAAGTGLSLYVNDEGKTIFKALVVDKEAVRKVKSKTYRMFSLGGNVAPGGRDPARPNVIHKMVLKEISLADRGSNPDAFFSIVKLDGDAPAAPADPIAKDAYQLKSAASVFADLAALKRDLKALPPGKDTALADKAGAAATALSEVLTALMEAEMDDPKDKGVAVPDQKAKEPDGAAPKAADKVGKADAPDTTAPAASVADSPAETPTAPADQKPAAEKTADKADDKDKAEAKPEEQKPAGVLPPEAQTLGKTDGIVELAGKLAQILMEQIQKMERPAPADDAVQKLDAARAERDDAIQEAEALTRRVADLEAKAATKGVTRVVPSKEADTGAVEKVDADASAYDQIKKIHHGGGRLIVRR